MVRILQYLGGIGPGGTQSFLMELYRQVDKNKIQFDFIIFPNQRNFPYYSIIKKMGGRIYESPRYNVKNHIFFCKWWDNFFKEHQEFHVLHSHIRGSASIIIPIAKKHGLITIAHSHSTSNGKGIAAIVRNFMQRPIRKQADYLFACSDKAGVWLYGKKATLQSNYKMIPNGIDIKRFVFDERKREEIRKELGIRQNEFVIGHLGRFSEPKNHKFLIDLFTKYQEINPYSRLLMVGDGNLYETVKVRCEELGINDKVIMPGNRYEAEKFYQAMDVFVFPSLWEGLPVSVVEAQANGLTCLLSENITRDVKLTDLVSYLPLSDENQWIHALETVQEKSSRELSEKNKAKLKTFDSATVAAKLQKFYIELDRKSKR